MVFVDTSKAKFMFSFYTSRPSARQWSLISLCSHQDPLRGNGHWFPMSHQDSLQSNGHGFAQRGPLRGNGHRSLYIKTLYKAMVIDFLCHIEALCEAMIIDFFCHIETLYEAMVIDLLTSRPSARQWSLISYVTSRSSARQCSSISLHQDPLRGNDHRSL